MNKKKKKIIVAAPGFFLSYCRCVLFAAIGLVVFAFVEAAGRVVCVAAQHLFAADYMLLCLPAILDCAGLLLFCALLAGDMVCSLCYLIVAAAGAALAAL